MTIAHRSLSAPGRSRLLMAAVLTAMVASLTVGLPGSAGAVEHLSISVTASVGSVEEDGTEDLEFTVSVDQGVYPDQDIEFTWETVDLADPATGEATAGEDYVEVPDAEGTTGTGTIPGIASTTPDTETTISVEVNSDQQIEPDETLEVRLVEVTSENASINGDTAAGTINDDDVHVSVTDATATEGQPGGFRISLSDDAGDPVTSPHPITIEYSVEAGDDLGGDEFTVDDSPITLQNESDALISFTTTHDDIAESDETFTLTLTSVTNAIFEDGQTTLSATGTILDDEPRVWISDVSHPEGHSSVKDFVFEVQVDPPAAEQIEVNYGTEDVDATGFNDSTQDGDYRHTSGTLTFPADSSDVQTVTVQVRGDTDGEGDETFEIALSWPEAVAEDPPNVSLDQNGVGTIEGDDNPIVVLGDAEVEEGATGETTELALPLSLVDDNNDPLPAGADIVLEYTTGEDEDAEANNRATSDEDYEAVGEDDEAQPGTVTIPAGESTWSVPVTVIGDDTDEENEVFIVTVEEPDDNENPDLRFDEEDQASSTGKILDDDGAPTITIGDAGKIEGNNSSAIRHMEFPVQLSHPSDDTVTVDFITYDGTAENENADGDYEFKAGTLTFEAHETEKTIVINIFGDTKPEANETLVVRLTEPDEEPFNAGFPDGASQTEATGTIINDDGAGVSVDDVTVDEGDSGTRDVVFRLTADTTDHDGFTIDVATADDTATAGSDYTPLDTTTVTFKAKQESATVAVPVRGDTDHEPDETFTLQLSNANFAVIVDGEGVATIVNDDEAPVDDGGDGGTGGDSGGDDGGTSDDGPDLGEISRSAGATRIETALQVSRDHWGQASDVVLANAAKFPDALAGGTLSALLDAPLLLTFPADLSDGVAAELDRLGAQTVWILGGPAAVSVEIQQQLLDAGYEVHRFFGEDRFATAAEIARGTGPSQAGEVVLALGAHDDPGRAWPDALSAGALAAVPDPLPVLLTTTDSLPGATTSALSDLQATTVYLLGGTAAISEDVEAQLVGLGYEVVRLAGSSRWGTSVAVATEALRRHGDTGAADVVFATGHNFPDGLAAGALAARLNGLLLLVPTDQLADETAEFLSAHARRLDRGVIVGGEKVVTADVADLAADALVAGG